MTDDERNRHARGTVGPGPGTAQGVGQRTDGQAGDSPGVRGGGERNPAAVAKGVDPEAVDPEWTVDVWFSRTFPVNPDGDDWRRVRLTAPDATEAELVATMMVARPFSGPVGALVVGYRGTPVRSCVIDPLS